MASSFISKDSVHGFWIYDSIFQVVCRMLYETLLNKEVIEQSQFIEDFKLLLDNNSKGYYHSYMHLNLDEFITNEISKTDFIQICEQAKKYVKNKGQFIKIDELKQMYDNKEIDYEWNSSLETIRIIRVLDYIENVVNDTIDIKVGDKINYEF